MPIDHRIALGVRPLDIPSPMESAGKVLTLRSLLDERDVRELQKQKMMREFSDDDALRAASVESGGDPRRLSEILMQRGMPTKALTIQKQLIDAKNAQSTGEKNAAETLKIKTTLLRDRLATVNDDAGLAAYRQQVATELGPEHAARLPETFDPAWRNRELLTASQLLAQNQPKIEMKDLGGRMVPVDMNPFTNPQLAQTILTKTMTPDAVAADARIRSEGAANRGVQIRGQNMTDARGRELAAATREMGGRAPAGYRFKPDGSLEAIPGGPAVKDAEKLTEQQGNATMFGIRAVQMDKTLKDMEEKGFDPTGLGMAKDMATAGRIGTNWMASAPGQQYVNAGKNFVAAVLRKESGATITDSEWASGTQLYVPMPGDNKAVLEQKKENRRLAISGMKTVAGPGGSKINEAGRGGVSGEWGIKRLP